MGMKEKIHGIVVPLVTPLETPERIDEAASARMIDRVMPAGFTRFFCWGRPGRGRRWRWKSGNASSPSV